MTFVKRAAPIVAAALTLLGTVILNAAPALAAPGEGCSNEQLRQESNVNPVTGQPYSVDLSECRAYEMVSPLDKQAHGAEDFNGGPLVSPDGNAVGFGSEGAFAGTENYLVSFRPFNTYIARRTPNGWATEAALAPASVISKPTLWGFNGDASLDLSTLATCGSVADFTTTAGGSPNFACAIRERDGSWRETPSYTDLTGETPQSPVSLFGSSSDLSDMVWLPGDLAGLLPGDATDGDGALYETTGLGSVSPQLRMISVNNEGTPLTTNGGLDGPYIGGYRTDPGVEGSLYQAVSSDGQTVYFTAEPAGGGPLTLYARTGDFAGGTSASPTTVAIAAEATYVGASADGSKVFFTASQELAATDHDSSPDLYEYDFDNPAGDRYLQVSAGGLGDPTPGTGASVAIGSVIALSSDGSHIYFSSPATLTTLPNGEGEHAVQGQGNVYGYDTETGQTQFVGDAPGSGGSSTAQVTPDGRYLIFETDAHLVPADTNGGMSVYRYDFQTGEVTWVSHSAPGFDALDEGDNATLPQRENATLPGSEPVEDAAMAYFGDTRRAISENGEYVIFTTSEKLQADDAGDDLQVYLWHNGTVSLISSGQAPGVTEAPGMSATGSDIVFATTSQLVGQDTDSLQDIYDARIGGGFPAPSSGASCSGEACQGATSPAPTFVAPGTAGFSGGGNLAPGSTSFPPATESKPKPKPLTNAQKLAKALKACRAGSRLKKRRLLCEKAARKRYAPARRATDRRTPAPKR
jgi:Tol biopolymer transport system component